MKSHDQINGNLLKTYSDCQSFLFFKSVKYASSASYPLCLLHMIVVIFIPQSIVVLFSRSCFSSITKPARSLKKDIRSENWHGKQIGILNADSLDFLVKYSGMVMLVFRITDYNITI
jgi:hypothetical protein